MDWLTAYKIPLGKWRRALVDLLNEHAAFAVQRHLRRPRLPDRRPDRADAGDPPLLLVALFAALAYWLHRSLGLVALVVVLAAPDHEPRLLGRDHRDAGARDLRDRPVHADRRADRHRRGAPALAVHRDPPDPRPDADDPDLRLPDPGADPVRPRRRAGPDLDHHLRHPGADPAHLSRRRLGAQAADRGGRGVRRDPPAAALEGRAAARHADHHGRPHPVHHAVALDGRDRGAGRRRRPRQAGGARAQHGQHRPGLRGRARDRAGRDPARSRLQAARAQRARGAEVARGRFPPRRHRLRAAARARARAARPGRRARGDPRARPAT